jgi:hypothetical protein
LPFGWKLCFMVVARTICLMENWLLLAVAAAVALALALALEVVPVAPVLEAVGLELGLELEFEHPAAPSTPAARTARPSRADEWRRIMFMSTVFNWR